MTVLGATAQLYSPPRARRPSYPAPLRLAAGRRDGGRGRGRRRAASASGRGDRRRRRGRPRRAALPARGRSARGARRRAAARATILVETPALPIPAASRDPRQAALAAAVGRARADRHPELAADDPGHRPGSPDGPGGGRSRASSRPSSRCASAAGSSRTTPRRPTSSRSAATTASRCASTARSSRPTSSSSSPPPRPSLHGGPAALLAAASARDPARAAADSLLETRLAPGWSSRPGRRARGRRPRAADRRLADARPAAADRNARAATRTSPRRSSASPARGWRAPSRLAARSGPLAGAGRPPLRPDRLGGVRRDPVGRARRGARAQRRDRVGDRSTRPLDAICIGIPRTTPFLPRERPNALVGAMLGLGYALRLWRDAFPVRRRRHRDPRRPLRRRFAHPTQQPYRAFFHATRDGRDPQALAEAERAAAADPRAIEAYRAGRTCHPRLPFADWDACRPALDRLGAVLVAGCRDAAAARQLGFVPTHGVRGRAGDGARARRRHPADRVPALAARTSRSRVGRGLRTSGYSSPRYVLRTCSFWRSAFASSASAIRPVSST